MSAQNTPAKPVAFCSPDDIAWLTDPDRGPLAFCSVELSKTATPTMTFALYAAPQATENQDS